MHPSSPIPLRWLAILGVTIAAVLSCPAIAQDAPQSVDMPVFELNEFDVVHSETAFAPDFDLPSPTFSYFDTPVLPKGDLILALNFVDRYRAAAVPGDVKWIGILHFPVVDGTERSHLKWICLYLYGGRMYGFDPTPPYADLRHFSVPFGYSDRLNPRILAKFAHRYVEYAFAAEYQDDFGDELFLDDDEDGGGVRSFGVDIPEGRIAPVYRSQQGKQADELVRMVYQFTEDPNQSPTEEAAIGKPDAGPSSRFSLKAWLGDWRPAGDPIDIASQLLAPRWNQRVIFHYTRRPFFLVNRPATETALLFNISTRIFAYHPYYGVWRTDASVADLSDLQQFLDRLNMPGISNPDRVEWVMPTTD